MYTGERVRCFSGRARSKAGDAKCHCFPTAFVAAFFLLLIVSRAAAEDLAPTALFEGVARSLPASVALQRLQQPQSETNQASGEQQKILNGKDAVRGQFPWQVALIRSDAAKNKEFDGFFCGGSLIDWKWVLTAAHCTYEDGPINILPPVPMRPEAINVYVGSYNFSGGERIGVQRIVRQAYNPRTLDNDVALLELVAAPKRNSHVERLKLLAADDSEPTAPGKFATAIGWGTTAKGTVSKTLQFVNVEIKSVESCNRFYLDHLRKGAKALLKKQDRSDTEIEDAVNQRYPLTSMLITGNMLCAGSSVRVADACFGDSGGPLAVKRGGGYAQAGVVSWGPSEGCGINNLFGVYVRLSRYVTWIADQVR